MKHISPLLFAAVCILYACGNLEKEITLELPAYEPKYVVECYLEPGQPYTLLLTRSNAYFDPFTFQDINFLTTLLEDSAEVRIRHDGQEVVLKNQLFFNPFNQKVFNYVSQEKVPADYDSDFELEIRTRHGKTLRSRTRLLPVVPIDSVVVEFSERNDTLARVLTYFTDPPEPTNFYRRMLHHHSLDSIPLQDFATSDDFVEDSTVVFGSGYDFAPGDTVYTTLVHIESTYHDFLESVFGAIDANGNPFAQPGAILSNVYSDDAPVIGIFTGLSYDRRRVIIHK